MGALIICKRLEKLQLKNKLKAQITLLGSCGLLLFFSAYFKDHLPYGFPINGSLTIVVPILIGYFFPKAKWWLAGMSLSIISQIAGVYLKEPKLLDLMGIILFYFYPMTAFGVIGWLFRVGVRENDLLKNSKINSPPWCSLVYLLVFCFLIGIYVYWETLNQSDQKVERHWLKFLVEPLGFGMLGFLIPNARWLVGTFLSAMSIYLTIFLVKSNDPLDSLIILIIPFFGFLCVAGFYLRILLKRQLVD